MICARMVENGYWTEIADTQGCQTMMWQKALCSKGFRALGCRRIIYLYIFIIYEIIYIEKKYAGCHSADTHAHPTVEDATADTIKKESLFFRKKTTESNSESRGAKIEFGFFLVFGSVLLSLRSAGSRSEGKRKPATAGGVSIIVATNGGAFFVFPTIAHGRQCRRVVLAVLLSDRSRLGSGNSRNHTGAGFPHPYDL